MNSLKIIIWDVRHGNALFAQTPNGKTIVIDLGAKSYGSFGNTFSPIKHLKRKFKLNKIDYLFIKKFKASV